MTESCGCATPKPILVGIDDRGVPVGPGTEQDGTNTLKLYPQRCIGCARCQQVCPHGVFKVKDRKAELVGAERCMECGACQVNCPVRAIEVDSGVGCAAAMIKAALTGGEPTCGDDCCR